MQKKRKKEKIREFGSGLISCRTNHTRSSFRNRSNSQRDDPLLDHSPLSARSRDGTVSRPFSYPFPSDLYAERPHVRPDPLIRSKSKRATPSFPRPLCAITRSVLPPPFMSSLSGRSLCRTIPQTSCTHYPVDRSIRVTKRTLGSGRLSQYGELLQFPMFRSIGRFRLIAKSPSDRIQLTKFRPLTRKSLGSGHVAPFSGFPGFPSSGRLGDSGQFQKVSRFEPYWTNFTRKRSS